MTHEKITSHRDIHIDSLKGMLIVLVVFGHMIEIFIVRSPLYLALYTGIYLFHIPLFVLIAGMFSKSSIDEHGYRSIFTRLIAPLLVFQCLYLGVIALKSGHATTPLLQPHWILWFLLSMVFWKLAMPLFIRLPYPLLMSLAIAMAAGFNDEIGYAISLSRTLYFFPFFLAGFIYGKQIKDFAIRYILIMVLIFSGIFAGVMWWSLNGLPYDALYGSKGYASTRVFADSPSMGRAVILILSFFASTSAIAIVYPGTRFLAFLGQRSLTIFVLHGFAVMAFTFMAKILRMEPSLMLMPLLIVVSLIIAFSASLCDARLISAFESIGNRRK